MDLCQERRGIYLGMEYIEESDDTYYFYDFSACGLS